MLQGICRGACLCGKVTYTIPIPSTNEKIEAWSCLCDYCRVSSGTFFQTFLAVLRPELKVTSHPELVAEISLMPGRTRSFCSVCSTPLFWNREGSEWIQATVATLDKEDVVRYVRSLDYICNAGATCDGLGGMVDLTRWQLKEGQQITAGNKGPAMDLSEAKKKDGREILPSLPEEIMGACACENVQYHVKTPTEAALKALVDDKRTGWTEEKWRQRCGIEKDAQRGWKYRASSCHCDSCVRWTGSTAGVCMATIPLPFFNLTIASQPSPMPTAKTQVEGLLSYTTPGFEAQRISCSKCYTSLFWINTDDAVDVTVATIKDQKEAMALVTYRSRIFMSEEEGLPVWRTLHQGLQEEGITSWERYTAVDQRNGS